MSFARLFHRGRQAPGQRSGWADKRASPRTVAPSESADNKKTTRGPSHFRPGSCVIVKKLHCVALALLLCAASPLFAGNPTNPILFVTQVPIPEEVNTRDITQSFLSTASPFSNHLADTTHAGRGGSLLVRFSNGQVVDLLAVADWSAIAGGQPPADAMAVRNPAVNWTATKAIFSMTTGKPSVPNDNTPYLFQLYEITLPTQAQLNASTKPVLTAVANQPPYNNVFPCYGLGG